MAGRIKLGLWGGNGGTLCDIDGHPIRLTKIVIRSGHVIDSLAYEYVQDGKTFSVGPWGGSGGTSTTIEFQPGEFLIIIDGNFGEFEGFNVVRSLTFITNVRPYGPFGIEDVGTPFFIPVASGRIVAFYGRFGQYVDAIGMYLTPN
ncbi:protein GOS9-like isoform X1 [Ananas comosus]|uniref:Protein GOS9-like isoform X1 n=1 Tax=Ananas comosus TaxID=4615 RepID=A0A6P5G680_ANACO|nr:protein GOS9-like isoform X1 [Ananas comosus]